MKKCNLINSDLSSANFMYGNLQGSDITNSKTSKTVFVKANLGDVNLTGIDKNAAYIKYFRAQENDDDYFI